MNVNTSVAVSHTLGEGPWRSSCQATPLITFCVVLKKTVVGNQIHAVRKTNKHTTCWSKFTDEESTLMYTKEWFKFNWGYL